VEEKASKTEYKNRKETEDKTKMISQRRIASYKRPQPNASDTNIFSQGILSVTVI